jgi:hypothetical protein
VSAPPGDAPGRGPRSRAWLAWLAVAVAAVTFSAFSPALWNGFVDFDDQASIVDNPWIRGFGRAELGWMLTTFHLGPYQPLAWLTLALDYRLWGLNAAGYHLTSLLLHAASGGLLFLLATRLLGRAGVPRARVTAGAALGALLWALHPLRVESVAWATERRDVLAGFFTLLTLLAYVREPGARGPALAATTLALLSKASAMVIPALLLVLDVHPLGRLGGARGWTGPAARRVWREKVPFVALAGVAAAVAVVAQGRAGALRPLGEVTPAMRLGAAMYGMGFYVWKVLLPIDLLPVYEYPRDLSPADPRALLGLGTVVLLAAAAVALRRRCSGFAAALLSYLAAIAPTLGLAQAGPQVVADRFTYLATLGWSVAVGGVVAAGGRLTRRLAAASPLVLLLAVATALQTTGWRDARTLWTRAVAIDPTNAFALKSMGDLARTGGDLDGAIAWYERAVALRPYVDAETNLAAVLARRGRHDEAEAHYRAELRGPPRPARARRGGARGTPPGARDRPAADGGAREPRPRPRRPRTDRGGDGGVRDGAPATALGRGLQQPRLAPPEDRPARRGGRAVPAWDRAPRRPRARA